MEKLKVVRKKLNNQLPEVLDAKCLIHSLKNEFLFIKVFLLYLNNQDQSEHVALFAKHKESCIEAINNIEKIIKQLGDICE